MHRNDVLSYADFISKKLGVLFCPCLYAYCSCWFLWVITICMWEYLVLAACKRRPGDRTAELRPGTAY